MATENLYNKHVDEELNVINRLTSIKKLSRWIDCGKLSKPSFLS